MNDRAESELQDIPPDLPNGSVPLPGIATAGQLREHHLPGLAGAGYRRVIDLRGVDEDRGFDEAAAVQKTGMEYVHLPVKGTPDDDTFRRFRDEVRDQGGKPAVVHCGTANRVGAMMLPHLLLDRGMDQEEALRTARAIGMRSPDLERAALEYVARERGR